MGPFSVEARSQCNIMQEMFKKMETLYIGLESYYVFDKQKYTLEEFMSDIKKFKDQFKVIHFNILHDYLLYITFMYFLVFDFGLMLKYFEIQ